MNPPWYGVSPALVFDQFSAHVSGQVQGRTSIRIPHTTDARCTQRNKGRPRVNTAPNMIQRIKSRCRNRIASANTEYTPRFLGSLLQLRPAGALSRSNAAARFHRERGAHALVSRSPSAEISIKLRKRSDRLINPAAFLLKLLQCCR